MQCRENGELQVPSCSGEKESEPVLRVVIKQSAENFYGKFAKENSMNQLWKISMMMECVVLLEMCLVQFKKVVTKIW